MEQDKKANVLEWSFPLPPVSLEPEEREVTPYIETEPPPVKERGTLPVSSGEYIPFTPVKEQPAAVPSRYVSDELEFVPWVASTTWKLLRVATPVTLVLVVLYGVALGVSWLISQPLFWIGLAVVGAVWYFVSASLNVRRNATMKPPQRNGGDVITNVHVKGNAGGRVITNVFVEFDDQ